MTTNSQVTVLGLGEMGSALARTLVDRGYRTTVWNRTATKAAPLAEAGATVAATALEAVAASPLVIICLLDSAAVETVLATIEPSVSGKVLVNVTSGSPGQARANADWARLRGAQYLDGGIMGDPPYVGTPNVTFSFSGDRDAFEAHEPTLRELGEIAYYGDDAGLAAVEFLAQVAVGYEFLIGLLHTLNLVNAEGVDVAKFAQRVAASIGGYVPLVNAFGTAISNGEYAPDLGSLNVQAALMDDLISHRESLGIEAVRMREVKMLMDRRIADGHGDQGLSSLFELLKASGPTSPTSTSGSAHAEGIEDHGRTPSEPPH
ncbi:NAD(P)-dependent oxidoreductase [Occultella gossypii]|uniref:NAD(P)-dependent oxidoreductase n=1 Tax=Occultella gossypii TaxID=2800820 RepID=A0ABS7SE53_9MICO|nr:NAD(P)-binding domain-containing protein [Occultella gossypii]MBZ2198632.1 NAD(P)-dependent oxidoreductase [Occultella gossypii]